MRGRVSGRDLAAQDLESLGISGRFSMNWKQESYLILPRRLSGSAAA
jgi:hypothetical protein